MTESSHMQGALASRLMQTRRLTRRLAVMFVIVAAVAYAGLLGYTDFRLRQELVRESRTYFDLVVTMRAWNASYHGVWVVKEDGIESNPYLIDVGVAPDVLAKDGRTFTMRNPSIMTREFAEMAGEQRIVLLNITSLNPLNPGNLPDEWETRALESFERGERESYSIEGFGAQRKSRYMAPLIVDETCMDCHGAQGYEIGDVRGGISVDIPYAETSRTLRRDALLGGLLASLVALFFVVSIYRIVGRYRERVRDADATLARMATTDALTGLANRWLAMERLSEEFVRSKRTGETLCVLLLDIDRFKVVNDTHGHLAGDVVLGVTAERIEHAVRSYDVTARIGGEEFLIIAPATDADEAMQLAERVRSTVSDRPIEAEGARVRITLSGGVAQLSEDDTNPDALMRRVDQALYRAKETGRDRIVRAD